MKLFSILGINTKRELFDLLVQFVKFGIVGISNTLISLAVYYVLIYFNVHYIAANTAGFIISVLNAFYWNNKYVFQKDRGGIWKPLIRCYLSYGVVFILSTFLLYLMVNALKISKVAAPLINLIVTIPLNFVLNKFWTFK